MDKRYPRTLHNGPGDEIVITGISGRYPHALNVNELEHNLYNQIDMIDDDERRWKHENIEIPRRSGKIDNLEKFDATFFGINHKQAHAMDPQSRILIEKAYEAILDAGLNPKSMRGSKTGVFIGASSCESEKTWFYDNLTENGYGLIGCCRAMLANRISYTLGFQGPSFMLDSSCSSSLYALDAAFTAIRVGECDAAIVGSANLLLHPYVTLQFARLGVVAPDGMARPFDDYTSGYVRAEAVSVILLQKTRDAKRIYGTVLHSKVNCDGYKEEGITYPSGIMQAKLLTEFYKEININPKTVDYIEAHGTGTIVGDPEECAALDEVFCKNRETPIPIGSVKSNLGHSEGAAGLCSIAKCIITMENQLIPPNLNFSKNRSGISSLQEKRLQVVHKTQKLDGPLVAVNSFGFGGANAHCLLKAHGKAKINKGAPHDSISRLVTWSGRTEIACKTIHEALSSQPLDSEYIALLHSSQRESVSGNVFKSYGLYKHVEDGNAVCCAKYVQNFSETKRPIVYVFSGMGSQWNGMAADLLELPTFRKTIEKCHELLKPKGLDLLNIITSRDKTVFDNILHSFVGIASIQMALCDCLTELNIQPDYMIGHSVGELGCAYADICLTMEEMILCAYSRGKSSLETETVKGSMAAIGQSYSKLKSRVPPEIDIACHNGPESCTISGPQNEIKNFVAKLKADGIFAREVNVSNIAYHSRYISSMGPNLLNYLVDIIKVPKKRSTKWLSTSVPKDNWGLVESQYCSAEYQMNNLLGPVLFEEAALLIPRNAILIEIAPHGLLQTVLRNSFTNAISIQLTQRDSKQNLDYFLTALGKIYVSGIDITIENLYPKIEFPVSRGTPRISHLIKWEHSEDWYVMKFTAEKSKLGEKTILVALQDEAFEYIAGYVINWQCLFPASGYLYLVWETLAGARGKSFSQINVQFEDIKYLRTTVITEKKRVEFRVVIQLETGRFEIFEGSATVVTGYINELPSGIRLKTLPRLVSNDHPYLPEKDFYKELRLRGYQYKGQFRNVVEARSDGLHGKVRWNSNWVTFMESLLQISILSKDTRALLVPVGIDKIMIDAVQHQTFLNEFDPECPESHLIEIFVNKNMKVCQAGGIEITGMEVNSIDRKNIQREPLLELYNFIPNLLTPKMGEINAARICIQHALENHHILKLKCVEILEKSAEPFITKLKESIDVLPSITGDLKILTNEQINCENIQIEHGTLSTQSNCLFIIKSNCATNLEFIETLTASLIEKGYIISRESVNLDSSQLHIPQGLNLVSVIPLENETLVLLQKKPGTRPKDPIPIKISLQDTQYTWLEQIKTVMKHDSVLVYSQNEPLSGILGFVNCLRREPNRSTITCVFIDDRSAPPFDVNNAFYKNQLQLNFTINIFRNVSNIQWVHLKSPRGDFSNERTGQWGTYRYLELDKFIGECPTDRHAFANITKNGDFSTIRFFNGAFSKRFASNQTKIQFAALNFNDVMMANGKLPINIFGENRFEDKINLGIEYSGVDRDGCKIMGITKFGSIGTHIVSDTGLTWICPKNWTLEEAATVPVAYSTVYTAFFITAKIKKGNSILIHAGTDDIGLAAITVALTNGFNVFTTVNTEEEGEFLLKIYPELKDSHIAISHDLIFENMIQNQTNGAGVDYVLNSLAGEKLRASLRCLRQGGQFLEIGKFDKATNTKIEIRDIVKNISIHSVNLDHLIDASLEEKTIFRNMLQNDIDSGIIKPLPATTYSANEIEAAFRACASHKHVGKVLLKIRDNPYNDVSLPIAMHPRVNCDANASYVIVGGLGGFGLELADWLIIRGARNILISSSRGVSKSYQAYRIKMWEVYGVIIKINISNIGTENGCETLLNEAIKLGPVAGIFNLAVILQDGILENQTVEKFQQCLLPKATATIYLDQLSRKLCPSLTQFVVFSSVTSGRGIPGQTNYGMANSIMERVIEERRLQNLPGKAIQWGAIGEVGVLADMESDKQENIVIGGSTPQNISSCLDELDNLLMCRHPIVACMVLAEKCAISNSKDIISSLMNCMSIKNIDSISKDATLAELGMDSLMAVEIKHGLDRDFNISLSIKDLRKVTITKLEELTKEVQSRDNHKSFVTWPETGLY